MSGGHYDYKQMELGRIADGMREDLARIGKQDEWSSEPYQLEESTVAALKLAIAMLEITAQLVNHIDWCMSGDTGEDTLKKQVEELMERMRTP